MSEKNSKDKIQVEPFPKDQHFFEWLEKLFDGSTQFPEKLETRVVSGSQFERMGPMIKQIIYAPETKENKEKSKSNGDETVEKKKGGKPSREELVYLSNELLFLCQRDCDQARKSLVYGVHASHFSREVDFYERFLIRRSPQGVHVSKYGEQQVDGDDTDTMEQRYGTQALHHDERMFNLLGAMVEGMVDRYERAFVNLESSHESTRQRLEKSLEMLERAESNRHQREQESKWLELKIKGVERGMDMAYSLAPPLLGQLLGQKTKESPESLALKLFFKKDTDGGKLTTEQSNSAFGVYEENPPHNVIKAGILSFDQAKLLYDISNCVNPPDALDELLPGGKLAVSQDQMIALQQIFPMEQISSLFTFIAIRMQQKNTPQKNS